MNNRTPATSALRRLRASLSVAVDRYLSTPVTAYPATRGVATIVLPAPASATTSVEADRAQERTPALVGA